MLPIDNVRIIEYLTKKHSLKGGIRKKEERKRRKIKFSITIAGLPVLAKIIKNSIMTEIYSLQ